MEILFSLFTGSRTPDQIKLPHTVTEEIFDQKKMYLSSTLDDTIEICYVLKKNCDSCISYEMFDWNTGQYILSSTTFDYGRSFVISNIENCHERKCSIEPNEMNINYLGKVIRNDFLGLSYSIYNHAESKLCTVDFKASISSCPLSFRIRLHSQLSMNEGLKSRGFNSYFQVPMKDNNDGDDEILSTRPPVFNTEVNTFLTNFGGRIKQASFANCVVTSSLDNYKICIRHGKISNEKYIFDYRSSSLSKVVAMGIFTTIHIQKIFVAI